MNDQTKETEVLKATVRALAQKIGSLEAENAFLTALVQRLQMEQDRDEEGKNEQGTT